MIGPSVGPAMMVYANWSESRGKFPPQYLHKSQPTSNKNSLDVQVRRKPRRTNMKPLSYMRLTVYKNALAAPCHDVKTLKNEVSRQNAWRIK